MEMCYCDRHNGEEPHGPAFLREEEPMNPPTFANSHASRQQLSSIVPATRLNMFRTYGPDGAGIEYWHPNGTRAVRLARLHRRAEALPCSCTSYETEQDIKHGMRWTVQVRTGATSSGDGENTFIDIKEHHSFDCALKHVSRIHQG